MQPSCPPAFSPVHSQAPSSGYAYATKYHATSIQGSATIYSTGRLVRSLIHSILSAGMRAVWLKWKKLSVSVQACFFNQDVVKCVRVAAIPFGEGPCSLSLLL